MTGSRDDVEVLDRATLYEGAYRLERLRLRARTYDGEWGPEVVREVFDRGHSAAVLLYDPGRDAVVLIEQFRAGPYAAGDSPWVLEIVAGVIEDGETPEDVARRETLEETGLAATALHRLGGYYTSPGSVSEFLHLFAASVDSARAGGVYGLQHEGEDIRVAAMPVSEALAALEAGRVRTGPAFAALSWLSGHRDELRRAFAALP